MELWDMEGLQSRPVEPPVRRSARLLRLEISFALILCDLVFIAAAFLATGLAILPPDQWAEWPLSFALFCAIYSLFAVQGRFFGPDVIRFVSKSFNRALAGIIVTLCTIALMFAFTASALFSGPSIWAALAFGLPFSVLLGRLIFEKLISQKYKGSLFDRVILIDNVRVTVPRGFRAINVRERGISPNSNDPMMRHWAALYLADADRVIIACQPERYQRWARFIKGSNTRVELLMPELNALDAMTVSRHGKDTTIEISKDYLDGQNRLLKRCFDISVATILLVLSAPLMLLCAIMIKLDDGGPVLFRQSRVGRGNRLFHLFKFRSMAAVKKANGDHDMTRFGRHIRRLSIDELPQLFNVLSGQMSLVGPRPHALNSLVGNRLFWEVDDKYWYRHSIKPGMTGLAQVRGYRGATPMRSDLTNRLHSDLEYLRGWTIWRDVMILFSTFRVMAHKNAN